MGLTKHYNKIPFRELKDEALEANGTGGFLTKPCPLMPDGKWYKIVTHYNIKYVDGTAKIAIWQECPDDELPLYAIISDVKISTDEANPSLYDTSSTAGIWLILNSKASDTHYYNYLEVREQFKFIANTSSLTATLGIQATSAWNVNKNTTQAYSMITNISQAKPETLPETDTEIFQIINYTYVKQIR